LIRIKLDPRRASNMVSTDQEETDMVEHSRQALVGAIGGSYISLAIADIDELTLSNFALLNSASFKNPMEAIQRYLKSVPRCPDKVSLAVAGSVDGEKAAMSHLPWRFSWNDIRAVTDGAKHVHFVNEFEALALAAPRMSAYDLLSLKSGEPTKYGTKLAISSGTGIGSAALVWSGDMWFATSGESARATFPAVIGDEFDIRSALSRDGNVTAGDILTGQGLVALYNELLRAASGGGTPIPMTPEEITKAGLSGENEVARMALDLMTLWLGRFAFRRDWWSLSLRRHALEHPERAQRRPLPRRFRTSWITTCSPGQRAGLCHKDRRRRRHAWSCGRARQQPSRPRAGLSTGDRVTEHRHPGSP
jgi:glucokinase